MIPNLLQDAEKYSSFNPDLSDTFRLGLRSGYIEGRVKENDRLKKKSLEWLKKKYGHFDGSLEDLLLDYLAYIEEVI